MAGDKFSHAVENRAGRAQPQGRQHRKPGQHTKHVAVRGQCRVFNDVAHYFAARQITHIDPLPLREQLACTLLIALRQRIADTGVMVAELAKPQRDVQHRHTPQHGKGPTQTPQQQPMDSQRQQCRRYHRQAPCHPCMVPGTGIKAATHTQRPFTQPCMNRIAACQRTSLLKQ